MSDLHRARVIGKIFNSSKRPDGEPASGKARRRSQAPLVVQDPSPRSSLWLTSYILGNIMADRNRSCNTVTIKQ
jgi:hypothetical protein